MVNKLIDTVFHRYNSYDSTKCQFFINYIESYRGTYETVLSGSHIPCTLAGNHLGILQESLKQGTQTGCWEYQGKFYGDCPVMLVLKPITAKDIGNGWISVDVSTTGAGTAKITIDGVEKERFTVTSAQTGYGTQFYVGTAYKSYTICAVVV